MFLTRILMARPKSLRPRKKKVTLSIDPDVWKRCQALSSRVSFMNWSELAELSFNSILDVFEPSLMMLSDGRQPQEVVDEIVKQLDVAYHEMLLQSKKTRLSQTENSKDLSLSTK